MMLQSVVQVLVAIVGLAIVAVIVSRKADTANILNSGFGGLSKLTSAAVSPVVGGAGGYGL